MTTIPNTIEIPSRRSLHDDRNALSVRAAEMTAARASQRERDDRHLLTCFLIVVLSFRADAKKQFARETRGTNGYAGRHVETLDQFLDNSFERYEILVRNKAIAEKRKADLSLKGGY